MAHEPPRYVVERRLDTTWTLLGRCWSVQQWAAALEDLRGRGWQVRVRFASEPQALVTLRPGDLWEGGPWS